MGKQRRRKRQNNKGKNAAHAPIPSSASDDAAANTPSSVLLQRIRHADPRTRHAALAAVSTTLLDTSCSRIHPKITPPLLQAIRERVVDSDLDVSQVAAGCLSNYLVIAVSGSAPKEIQSMTAGWTILLVGRLKQCYDPIVASAAAQENLTPKQRKERKQWLQLAVQCLHPLCTLVESNSEAVARLTSDLDPTTRLQFHQTLLEFLQTGQQWLLASSSSAAAAAASTSNQQPKEEECKSYQTVVTLAARTLHSAWDDNAELLVPWQQECPDAFHHGLNLLKSIALEPSQIIPVTAKLHATGCLIAARPTNDVETTQNILQVLGPHLQLEWTTPQSILSDWKNALEKWGKEEEDNAMERDIIRKQQEKKEKARAIARRQKDTGKPEPMQQDEEEGEDNDMNNDDGDNKNEVVLETKEALEQARKQWNDCLLPLQLTLELLANLTSSKEEIVVDDGDDEMMMEDWGPEQEAKLLQQQQQQQSQQGLSAEEEALQKILVESTVPQRLAELFRQLYHVPTEVVFPEQSRQDLEELQSKTMACLGNCWSNIPNWPVQLTWNDLQQVVAVAAGLGKEGLVNAMLMALKSQPALRKQWQPEHLAFWLQLLQDTNKNESLSIRRDAINMMGVLCCQEPHPKEVNHQVCTALLSVLTSNDNLMLECEVLNVLMDIYGGDDGDENYHGAVFEELQVLGHFQRSIPNLKKTLQQHAKQFEVHSEERMEVEQWKEIVLNASRFVQYKKGQL